MPFEKINPQTDFAKMEESILEFWKKENIFYRSVAEKNDTNRYFFYDKSLLSQRVFLKM